MPDPGEERRVTSPKPAPPCTIVVFGAAGDLTKRLLMPAIYNLAGAKLLDDKLQIIGLDHNDRTTDSWRTELSDALQSFTKDAGAEFHPDSHRSSDAGAGSRGGSSTRSSISRTPATTASSRTASAAGNVIFYLRGRGALLRHDRRAARQSRPARRNRRCVSAARDREAVRLRSAVRPKRSTRAS